MFKFRMTLLLLLFSPLALGQELRTLTETDELLGPLPSPGSLEDILSCAGANEAYWLSVPKSDPYDSSAAEAKRKAGWYAAVALWIFAVDSKVVLDAIQRAQELPQDEAFELARKCRKAPNNWRE